MSIIVQHPPIAFSRSKWQNINFFFPNYFNKGFCHDSLFTMKVKCKSLERTRLKFQRNFFQTYYTDKAKVWFGFRKVHGMLCIRYLNQKFKIQYQHDFLEKDEINMQMYGSLDFKRNGSDPNIKMGVSYFRGTLCLDGRLKIKSDYNILFYQRLLLYFDQVRIGAQAIVDLRKQKCFKKDLFLSYNINNYTFQFKATQDQNHNSGLSIPNQLFNRLINTNLYRTQRFIIGFRGQVWKKDNLLFKQLSGMIDYNLNKNTHIKVKVDDKFLCTVLLQTRPNLNTILSVGSQFHLKQKQNNKLGVKVTMNI